MYWIGVQDMKIQDKVRSVQVEDSSKIQIQGVNFYLKKVKTGVVTE